LTPPSTSDSIRLDDHTGMSWLHQFTAFRVTSGVMTDDGTGREPDVTDQGNTSTQPGGEP
jgi:hypothetical protein